MRMLLFGPPGVGKGTQADLLSKKYNLKKFSMGDVLRHEMSLKSLLGNKVGEYIKGGNLAPDDIILELVKIFLDKNRDNHILFDGFPRTMNQALILDKTLVHLNLSVDIALEMYLDKEELFERLVNRRHCPNCGTIFNYRTNPPRINDICDNCGEKLIKRVDDDKEIIKRRIEVYEEETRPLADYYKSLSIYKQIDASGSKEEIFNKISKIIDGYIDKR